MGTMVDVMHFFEMKPAQFKPEWARLSEQDKEQLKEGVGRLDKVTGRFSGPMTY